MIFQQVNIMLNLKFLIIQGLIWIVIKVELVLLEIIKVSIWIWLTIDLFLFISFVLVYLSSIIIN